VLKVRFY